MNDQPLPNTFRPALAWKHSVTMEGLPREYSYAEKFRLAVDVGFEGIEINAVATERELDEIRAASLATGLKVHSVQTLEHWFHPLTSADPAAAKIGLDATLLAIRNAHALGADTVLVIPGMVDTNTSYAQAYHRSQEIIRNEILPLAQELKIVLGIENVWNGFLLGAYEYARYVDEFESPWVRVYLDVGNMIFGQPEDWVEICGARIIKVHVKDFWFNERGRFGPADPGKGDVNWSNVHDRLADIGFSGWIASSSPKRNLVQRVLNRLAREKFYPAIEHAPVFRTFVKATQGLLGRRMLEGAVARYNRHLNY